AAGSGRSLHPTSLAWETVMPCTGDGAAGPPAASDRMKEKSRGCRRSEAFPSPLGTAVGWNAWIECFARGRRAQDRPLGRIGAVPSQLHRSKWADTVLFEGSLVVCLSYEQLRSWKRRKGRNRSREVIA